MDSTQGEAAFCLPWAMGLLVDRDTGSKLYTFTIITTRANAPLRPIHDRIPVMYHREMGHQRLEQPFGNDEMTLSLVLQPLQSERIEPYEVSTLVNSPDKDSLECVRRIAPNDRTGQLPRV